MLNLFKLSKKINKNITTFNDKNIVDKSKKTNDEFNTDKYKHIPVSYREWCNSVYSFNKNNLSNISQSSVSTIKLITSYLNAYNSKLEDKVRKTKLSDKKKRLSCNKIHVSNGEFKHTNDKVIIVLYTYNRQKYNYLNLLKKNRKLLYHNELKEKFFLIKHTVLGYLKKNLDKKNFNIIEKSNLIHFYKKWIKKAMRTIKFYLYIKQLLYINNSKYNYTYLETLKKYLEKIYNKKVEFNLINLKCLHLNSDILLKVSTAKVTKHRMKYKNLLKKLINVIEIKPKYIPYKEKNVILDINKSIQNIKQKAELELNLKKIVLEKIKYKQVLGVRLQFKGRLTKRITAAKSVKKFRQIGTLKNLYSSLWYKRLSTVILKGNLKSNLQYTKLNSKARIGSFGAKGWVSGI